MTAMEKMIVEFEIELRGFVGTFMKRSTLNSARLNYGVEYLTKDESGVILITCTHDDSLKVSFLRGKHSSMASEIYSTPNITNFSKAEQTLALIKQLIQHSAYESYEIPIEEYAKRFKNDFKY